MARKPRIEYEGAFYRVITRCNQRQKILKLPASSCRESSILKVIFYSNRSLTPQQAVGNALAPGFKDPADHQEYLQFLTIYKDRSQFSFPVFVLRGDHVNPQIETTPLSKRLQGLNQRYPSEWRER